jgi:S-adenosylmethionine hydrolase
MPLITLSTDFGLADPYVGVMKGVILEINPQARLVDLTHDLSNRRLAQAAMILQPAFAYFPLNTVHLAVVDPGVGGERRLLAIQANETFWVGPDNGLFTLVLKNQPQAKIIRLTNSKYFLRRISNTFHGRDILAPVAAHLSLGVPLEEMGSVISDPVLLDLPEPEIKEKEISGEVLWADHFGNLISNIHHETLHPVISNPALTVLLGTEDPIRAILQNYSQGLPGSLMALIGSSGYLEIASNLGRAAEKVGYAPSKKMKVLVTWS